MTPYKLQRTVSYFNDETTDIITSFKEEFETKNTLVEPTVIEPLHISGSITEYIFAENIQHLISIITQIEGISSDGVEECFNVSDLNNNVLFTEEYNLNEITQCVVSNKILLPDDEAYETEIGICSTEHCAYHYELDSYVSIGKIICTDPDTNQYGKRIGERQYYFYEDEKCPDGNIYLKEAEIDLDAYTLEEIEEWIEPYGYTVQQLKEENHLADAEWLFAECIFEQLY